MSRPSLVVGKKWRDNGGILQVAKKLALCGTGSIAWIEHTGFATASISD